VPCAICNSNSAAHFTGVAPADDTGAKTGSDGRVFYLWQGDKAREMFDTLGFKVCDFLTSVSKTGSGDVWMSYVLDKTG